MKLKIIYYIAWAYEQKKKFEYKYGGFVLINIT